MESRSQTSVRVGVFDSGVGGLTVVRRLLELGPSLPIIYFGDTARVPYGTKSADTICRYAVENTRFLLTHRPTAIVVACNSVSALALDKVAEAADGVPVFGVIEPGAELATQLTRTGRIGVIGTAATISSGAYERALLARKPEAKVFKAACPLFVPLAEEGLFEHEATRLIASEYLAPILKNDIDTLVLGCTHYPLLSKTIARIVGPEVRIVDSGHAVAALVSDRYPCSDTAGPQIPQIYVSDLPNRFQRTAELFLGMKIGKPIQIDLQDLSQKP